MNKRPGKFFHRSRPIIERLYTGSGASILEVVDASQILEQITRRFTVIYEFGVGITRRGPFSGPCNNTRHVDVTQMR